jgi:hypothetical protein
MNIQFLEQRSNIWFTVALPGLCNKNAEALLTAFPFLESVNKLCLLGAVNPE